MRLPETSACWRLRGASVSNLSTRLPFHGSQYRQAHASSTRPLCAAQLEALNPILSAMIKVADPNPTSDKLIARSRCDAGALLPASSGSILRATRVGTTGACWPTFYPGTCALRSIRLATANFRSGLELAGRKAHVHACVARAHRVGVPSDNSRTYHLFNSNFISHFFRAIDADGLFWLLTRGIIFRALAGKKSGIRWWECGRGGSTGKPKRQCSPAYSWAVPDGRCASELLR